MVYIYYRGGVESTQYTCPSEVSCGASSRGSRPLNELPLHASKARMRRHSMRPASVTTGWAVRCKPGARRLRRVGTGQGSCFLSQPPDSTLRRPACRPAQPRGCSRTQRVEESVRARAPGDEGRCTRAPGRSKGCLSPRKGFGGAAPLCPDAQHNPQACCRAPVYLLRRNTRGAVLRRGRGVACVRHKVAFAQKARDRGHGHADAHHNVLGHSACERVVRNDVRACVVSPALAPKSERAQIKGQQ